MTFTTKNTCIALLCVAFVLPLFASADSVVWTSSSLPGGGVPYLEGESGWMVMNSAMVSVQYMARVSLVSDAGAESPLSCGGAVPKGSKVKFSFVPHANEDISWFATGSSWDSPYGLWVPGAAREYANACTDRQYFFLRTPNNHDVFVRFIANPPAQSITGLGGASCSPSGSNGDMVCTANENIPASFVFGNTYGHFFAEEDYKGCRNQGSFRLPGTTGWYQLPIAQQTISCPITVTTTGAAPSNPNLSSGGSCVVGTAHTITMSSTDPDGDNIRYGIDWNADGSIDEYAPASGYVASGASQSVSHTWATAGNKIVRVLAEDNSGRSSGWSSVSVNCGGEPGSCPIGYSFQNNICVFVGCPSGYHPEGGVCLPDAPQCPAGATGLFCVGNDVWRRTASPQCSENFDHSCPAGYSCSGGACLPPEVTGNITATPILVRAGDRTTVSWTTSNMLEDSCSIISDPPSGSDDRPSGSLLSSPIFQRTIFTLMCTTPEEELFTDTATVDIVPQFKED